MLLTEAIRTTLLAASAGACAVGAIALARQMLARRSQLPPAIVRGRPPIVRIALVALLPCGLATLWWTLKHDVDVLLARDGTSRYGALTFERRVGKAPLDAAIAPGSRDPSGDWGRPCWIVNESSKPLRQVRIEWHHDQPFVETDAVVIDPGRRALDCQVDYYGTTFAPPATARDIAVARLNHAVWLTWEP